MMGASRVRNPLNRRRIALVGAGIIGAAIVVVSGYLAVQHMRYDNVTAYFTSTTGLYVGDDSEIPNVNGMRT
ncbi:MAG: mammalian cell entry protein, partial [Rhodococcus sp. (in: high G+C Gram-positive bacteria)]